MNQHREDLLKRLIELRTVANSLAPGADRLAVQAATANVIRAAGEANACGPLRPGLEIPTAT